MGKNIDYDDLKYYVVEDDFNRAKMVTVNIFNYRHVIKSELDRIAKLPTEKRPSFEEFDDTIRRCVMYQFWSRCEYEIVIHEWATNPRWHKKVDVYDQLRLNWDYFINQCWEYTTQHWRKVER